MVMHYEKIKHDEDFKNISEATQKKISTLYSTYEKKLQTKKYLEEIGKNMQCYLYNP